MTQHRISGLALVCASALFLAACSSAPPVPLEKSDVLAQSRLDRVAAQKEVEPVQNALSLEEAVARALKYNLERRSRMMEEALALNQYDVSRYDMLPKFMAQAGYFYRDKDRIVNSVDSVTGAPSLANPSISSEREHYTSDLGLTWNLLDFGVSYIAAKQNADRVLIASERRRKAMHVLIQDVIGAFWRTASAQKLNEKVKASILSAEAALADARKAEAEGLRSPLDSLKYQRQLLENLKLLEGVDQELASARVELANMLNVPLAIDLKVVEPTENLATRVMALPIEQLEEVAIAQNADLREQFYNARIAAEESKKIILRMFPSLSFSYGMKYDSDRYMVNHRWQEAGAQISFNIFNLLSAPAQMKLAEAGVTLAEQRRLAMQMALLAQLHIARLQYANTMQQFNRADAIWVVDEKINTHTANRERAQAQSKLEAVANNTAAILSLLRRYQALSQVHAASGKLQASLGMEPEIASVREASLSELTEAVRKSFANWQAGNLPALPAEAPLPGPSSEAEQAIPVATPKLAETPKPQAATRGSELALPFETQPVFADVKPLDSGAVLEAPAPSETATVVDEVKSVEVPKAQEEVLQDAAPKVSGEAKVLEIGKLAAKAKPVKLLQKQRIGRPA
jgi:outer membrane protein TolC